MRDPAVVLVGMRGCGKSAVGRCLARTLGWPFTDLDDEALAREGYESVAAMWAAVGQDAFRDAETRVLREVLSENAIRVLALGGGTLTAPGAIDALKDAKASGRAVVVYLRCSLDTLRARLAGTLAQDANRPSVTGGDPLDELGALLRGREPAYRAASDVEIDAERGSPEDVAAAVAHALRDHSG